MLVGRDALDHNSVFSSILGLFGLIGKLLPLVVFPGVAVPDRDSVPIYSRIARFG